MPYIPNSDRPFLDEKIDTLAEELALELSKRMNNNTEISSCYKDAFLSMAMTLHNLERNHENKIRTTTTAGRLAYATFKVAKKYGYRGAWLGYFNYALTRLIQVVPAKMVRRKVWKEEMRYWLHAMTVGALESSAMTMHTEGKDDWIADGLVGVLIDVKDEYKRRVNSAYEAFQIRKSGDCYTTPYRTEVVDVKDERGGVIGYQEIMKDFRGR